MSRAHGTIAKGEQISDHSSFVNLFSQFWYNWGQSWPQTDRQFLWHHIQVYVDFFFQLNLLPPYSLGSQGDNILTIFKELLFYVIESVLLQAQVKLLIFFCNLD